MFLCRKHVAENAMHQHMHISPVQNLRSLNIHMKQIGRIKADKRRIRSHRPRRQIHSKAQTSERRSHKTHGQIQFCTHRIQYFISCLF